MRTISIKHEAQPAKITAGYLPTQVSKKIKSSWLSMFINYAISQEENRFRWLALGLALQGCILAPITIFAIVYNGNEFALWIPCIIAFALTEVVNLAALSTKITIPVLFAGILIDVLVVILSFII
ncbi:MAG: hypothetical protein QM737_00080 [Ferruginibacter sp.]